MSDINLTIGVEASEVNKALGDINQRLEALRSEFRGSGAEINKEMQRTASAIEKLKIPLSEARQAIMQEEQEAKRLRAEMQRLGVTLKDLTNKNKVLTDEQRKSVTNYKSQIAVVNKAKDRYNEQATVIEKLRQRYQGLSIVQKQATGGTGGLASGLGKLKGIANQVLGVFGAGLGLYGFVRLLKSATKTIAEFEKSQLELAAVSGATASQMSILSQQAISIGSSTKYGAAGVSELQVQLARMGFTINQIGEMAKGITNLATAAGEDLPKASETVAFTLRAYNLDASETKRVTDVMAASFNKSALDLEKFRQSIKYIGPIANQANFSIEETASLLAKLADAGISGSLAGTSLRNVISQLADSSSNISQRVGFAVKNFDDFTRALRALNEQGIDLAGVFDIIDRRAATAFTSLLSNASSLEAFNKEMKAASGAAERMANIQKESLTYQTKLAKNAWDGFILSIDKGDGFISNMYKGTLKAFSKSLNSLSDNMYKISDQTKDDLTNLNVLVGMIKNVNLSVDDRIKYLNQLKSEYPEYFSNLKEDIATSEDIKKVLDEIGMTVDELRKKLKGEVIMDISYEDVVRAEKRVEELEEKRRDAIKRQEEYNNKLNEGLGFWGKFRNAISVLEKEEKLRVDVRTAMIAMGAAQSEQQKALEKYFDTALNSEFVPTEAYISALRRYGKLEEGVNTIVSGYRQQADGSETLEELEAIHAETTANLKEEYDLLDKMLKWVVNDEQAHKLITQDMIRLREAQTKIDEDYRREQQKMREENRKQADSVRLQNKLRELEIIYAEEGIIEERRLAEVRKESALALARLEEGEKGIYARKIANLQYLIDMQKIARREIQIQNEKNEEIIKNDRELNKIMRQLVDEQIEYRTSSIDQRDYSERQRLEVESQQIASQRIIEDIYNRAEDEKRILKNKLDEDLIMIGDNDAEKERLRQEHNDRVIAIDEKTKNEILAAEEEDLSAQRELYRKQLDERIAIENEILDERLAIFDAQQEQEKLLFDSKRQNEVAIRNFEKQQAIARLEELKAIAEARKAILEEELVGLDRESPEDLFKIGEVERQLEEVQRLIDSLDLKIDLQPFDKEAWEEMISALKNLGKEVGDTLKQMLKDREDAAKREREILDGRIAEAQRAVDTELKLYEQGFASNVETKRKELAELEKLRENALKAEEKAIAQRRAMDAVLQATNLITAVSQIIRSQSLAGPVGIALAAGGIAAMFALFNNAKKLSSQTTKYEKGGSFTLEGRSHASGGVLLAPGHEAQGGERVSVFNRSATKRFGSQIRQFTDDINKGKNPLQNINVFADNKDLRAMRKIMEREQVEYHDNYKVIRRGNVTTICRN